MYVTSNASSGLETNSQLTTLNVFRFILCYKNLRQVFSLLHIIQRFCRVNMKRRRKERKLKRDFYSHVCTEFVSNGFFIYLSQLFALISLLVEFRIVTD